MAQQRERRARPQEAPCAAGVRVLVLVSLLCVAVGQGDAIQDEVSKTGLVDRLPVYIVRMRNSPPVAGYTGGIEGLAATASAQRIAQSFRGGAATLAAGRRRFRFDPFSRPVREFSRWLGQMQQRVAGDAGVSLSNVLYSYKYVSNGFAARLTAQQVRRLRNHPAVAQVKQSIAVRKLTTDSPAFLQLPSTLWAAAGGQSNAGAGVVVGIVDTGIWPEHPSFAGDASYPNPPATWKGNCTITADFKACNRKLIGARYFSAGFKSAYGSINLAGDWLSPRDADGHGTWCAGAAAGNSNVQVAIARGQSAGLASGVAPRAFLSVYKVFWGAADGVSATWADIEAAVNKAVADGVDVISLSLGGLDPSADYFDDSSYLYANAMGVTVAFASGNAGSPPYSTDMYRTVSNFSPFYLTVGASTISRRYSTSLVLGNGVTVAATGFGSGSASVVGLRVIEGVTAMSATSTSTQAQYCYANSLDATKVSGRIVICTYGGVGMSTKVGEVLARGGKAVVITGVPSVLKPFPPYDSRLPMAYLDYAPADTLLTYVRSNLSPTATLSTSFSTVTDLPAPNVVYFSSSGPVLNPSSTVVKPRPTNDILKPDIIAPGVSLWSSWRAASTTSSTQEFAMISGTSMATPHVAGIAALLTQRYPTWSPPQIMSAIMTTASTTTNQGSAIGTIYTSVATPFEMGQGHINSSGLLDPGLTYTSALAHYYNFLAGQDLTRTKYLIGTQSKIRLTPLAAYNLNRPTISVSRLVKSVVVTRWVVNVYSQTCTYTASVVAPANVRVAVSPSTFTISPAKSQTFTVTFTVTTASTSFSYGSLTWRDQYGHAVRSVLAVQPISL
ncbi:hypothetical protein CLOM_g17025 [Closterium sp. NIES-68]|nr:hypothetical protein CLOM_g17025 [Closterium sp. NIES-68]GJP80952.1 hypothetical protein CLOP_g11143 [Closterium sp. NIES-67]